MIIAIDGPSASGKSTLGRMLARELGLLYIDTGSMYRAVALAMLGQFEAAVGGRPSQPTWADAVRALATDPDLRARMGQAGRQWAARQFSVERWAPEFASLIDRLPRQALLPRPERPPFVAREAAPVAESRLFFYWEARTVPAMS